MNEKENVTEDPRCGTCKHGKAVGKNEYKCLLVECDSYESWITYKSWTHCKFPGNLGRWEPKEENDNENGV